MENPKTFEQNFAIIPSLRHIFMNYGQMNENLNKVYLILS